MLSHTPRRQSTSFIVVSAVELIPFRLLSRSPKIQRLVTPERLQRRRHLRSLARRKTEVQKAQIEEYKAVLAKRLSEKKQRNVATKAKRAAHH